jgi:hypothetical protein
MNLVDSIKDQLTSEVTGKLSSLLGGGEAQVKSALGAAVPALLSALSGAASSGGADQIASALRKFDSSSARNLTSQLTSNPEQALEQGGSLLGSLFGGNTLSGLASTVARFLGQDSNMVKKLLGYISPLVLGTIAKQFQSQGEPITARGLTDLFSQQKSNIASALPSGLSLASVPGLSDISSAAAGAAKSAQRTAEAAKSPTSPALKALVPLAILALVGFLAWQYFGGRRADIPNAKAKAESITKHTTLRPVTETASKAASAVSDTASKAASAAASALPDVSAVTKDLTSVFTDATESLNGIKDVPSAEAAAPKLNDLTKKIDGLRAMFDKIPATAREAITKIATDNLSKLSALIEKVLAIPGVKEKIGPTLEGILTKLRAFEGKA